MSSFTNWLRQLFVNAEIKYLNSARDYYDLEQRIKVVNRERNSIMIRRGLYS